MYSGVPVVQSTTDEKEGEAGAGQKRAREEEVPANGDHPAKKVDVKES